MLKKRILSIALAALTVAGATGFAGHSAFAETAAEEPEETAVPDQVYQVSLLQSLTLGGYDGLISVEELKEHGDIGIGTFEGVNGEMIVLDGVVYQALYDGSVVEAADDETVPYATVGTMDADITESISAANLDELKEALNAVVEENGENEFYFVRLDGTFANVEVRSELKQEKPYKSLDEALATDQREFSYDNVSGTIVGLYCPAYMSGLNTPGWHFHFISDDRQCGGHILGITGFGGTLTMDEIAEFQMFVPTTDDFNGQDLGQDQSERIQSVEQKGSD